MKIFYRLSENSYKKHKLPGADKLVCFENFKKSFPNEDILVIADHCSDELVEKINHKCEQTNLGNAGAFRYALQLALEDNDINYFVEDDYIHKESGSKYILDGINLFDYVTLYDHPDKYQKVYNYHETCDVYKTNLSHWRTTISTTMTFAANTDVIKRDYDIWMKWTQGFHPNDHDAFCELKARLGVCIPGRACHVDLTHSEMIDEFSIEPWVVSMLIKDFESIINSIPEAKNYVEQIVNVSDWEKLRMLAAIYSMLN